MKRIGREMGELLRAAWPMEERRRVVRMLAERAAEGDVKAAALLFKLTCDYAAEDAEPADSGRLNAPLEYERKQRIGGPELEHAQTYRTAAAAAKAGWK